MSNLSICSPTQILNSPLNQSSAKFHYSFAKSPRFRKPIIYCDQAYYKSANSKSNRAASFGYGTKFDFTKKLNIVPEPTAYNISSVFEHNRNKAKGSSFGLSREAMKETSYIRHSLAKNPGPGQYKANKSQGMRERAYSMRPKTVDPWVPNFLKSHDESYEIPGPGQYNQIKSLGGDGKYFYSKFKSQGSTVINPQSKRFQTEGSIVPGPGDYKHMATLTDDGSYKVSRYKGYGKRIFGNEQRSSFIDEIVKHQSHNPMPGPGNYRQHSEFGLYENPALLAKSIRPYTAGNGPRTPSQGALQSKNLAQTSNQFWKQES